jgi:hypothetical protein
MFNKKTGIVAPWRQRLRTLKLRRQDKSAMRMHRAMFHLRLHRGELLFAILIPLIFNILLSSVIDELVWFWRDILEFWVTRLNFDANVKMTSYDLGYVVLWLPTASVESHLPSAQTWWISMVICAIAYFLTYSIKPAKGLPARLIIRALIFLQVLAQIYFALIPASFPVDLDRYVGNNLFMGILLMFLIPWILGMTYYVFDFPLLQKLALTALTLSFFVIALPLQYLLHVNLLAFGSLLFAPILYLAFGFFPDVMVFVCFYSWGMSWRFRKFRNT